MKHFKISTISSLIALIISTGAMAASNPSQVNIKIYGAAVSTNADCSNAKVIGYNAAGTTFDFIASPAIASGAIAAGTYPCVILYMDSLISFKPSVNDGACTAGQTYQQNLCNLGNSCTYTEAQPDANNILQYLTDGKNPVGANHTDTTSDKVLLFLSTSSLGTGESFIRPRSTDWTTGHTLTSPLVVSAAGTTGEFVVNFNGQVMGDNAFGVPCYVNAPTFGFR